MTNNIDNIEYDEEVDDIGYTEYDWDNLSEDEVNVHETIISSPVAEVRKLDFTKLTDLQVWAAAQVLLDEDATEDDNVQGTELVRQLIFGKREHPAIDYLAIAVEFCFDAVMENELEDAREILAGVHDLAEPDDSTPLELEAMILFAEGNEAAALAKYQDILDEYGDDPEVLLNLASQFAMFGVMDRANQLVDQAEELARNENDQELVEVIEDLRVRLNAEDEDGE